MKIFTHIRPVALFVVLVGIVFLGFQCPPQAIIVEVGWDLFATGTAFLQRGGALIPFEGSRLESFDFGGAIGEQNTGTTDTIIRRLEVAEVQNAGEMDTIPIEVVALQLKSKIRIGGEFLYATLSNAQSSSGTMTITFDDESGGTFDSEFTVFFDLRLGSPDGAIIGDGSKNFVTNGAPWGREPTSPIQIEGVNVFLNGNSRDADFWPVGNVTHDAGDGSQHNTVPPEEHDQGGGN